MPTSVPNGSNNILLRCRPHNNRRKLRRKHSCRPTQGARQDCWASNPRVYMLASLLCLKQSYPQPRCCQASRFRHSHSRHMLVIEQHLPPGTLANLDRLHVLCTSRSCRSSRQTRCIFSSRHPHNQACSNCNRTRARKNNLHRPSTSITGCLQHHNKRRTQAAIRQRRPQVNTNLRPLPHTNPVNVRRLMRLTVSTSAPPRSGRPKALTQRLRLQHRRHNPIPHRPSRMYRRHRHQRPDEEDTYEPVQMHLHEVQRVL